MPKFIHRTQGVNLDHRQSYPEAGFVLPMVLLVIVLISGATVLLINQNAVDRRSAVYHHQQQSLYTAADAALMPIWQLPEQKLSSMIADEPGSWLAALIKSVPDGQYPMVNSCDGFSSYSLGVSDGNQDNVVNRCTAKDFGYLWQAAYALPVTKDHYLYQRMDANDMTNPKDASGDEQPVDDARLVHVLMYAIAAQHRPAIEPCLSHSLLHARISSCLIEQGVRHKLVSGEWLVWIDPNQTEEALDNASTIKVIRLRNYDLRTVRE